MGTADELLWGLARLPALHETLQNPKLVLKASLVRLVLTASLLLVACSCTFEIPPAPGHIRTPENRAAAQFHGLPGGFR